MTGLSKPEVSVIVPCYNQGAYLEELLFSVRLASSQSVEIVIVDDGSNQESTLRSIQNIRERQESDIIFLSQSNLGLSAARNAGLLAASGKYVKFLDSDDLLTRGAIDRQREYFRNDPSLSVVIDEWVYCDSTRKRFWKEVPSTVAGFSFSLSDFLFEWELGLTVPIHSAMISRELALKHLFNPKLKGKEDWVFWCELAADNTKFVFNNTVGCVYRKHSLSMTDNFVQMSESWLDALEINLRLAETRGISVDKRRLSNWIKHFYWFYLDKISEHKIISDFIRDRIVNAQSKAS